MEINIDKIQVILSDGSDRIIITPPNSSDRIIIIPNSLSSPFPTWSLDTKAIIHIEVAHDYGIEYVKKNFNCIPEVINTRIQEE